MFDSFLFYQLNAVISFLLIYNSDIVDLDAYYNDALKVHGSCQNIACISTALNLFLIMFI